MKAIRTLVSSQHLFGIRVACSDVAAVLLKLWPLAESDICRLLGSSLALWCVPFVSEPWLSTNTWPYPQIFRPDFWLPDGTVLEVKVVVCDGEPGMEDVLHGKNKKANQEQLEVYLRCHATTSLIYFVINSIGRSSLWDVADGSFRPIMLYSPGSYADLLLSEGEAMLAARTMVRTVTASESALMDRVP